MKIFKLWFGQRLSHFREKAGLTNAELAEILEVQPSTISRWQSGKDFPEDWRLPSICKALNVTESSFLQFPIEPTKTQTALVLSISSLQEENERLRNEKKITEDEERVLDAFRKVKSPSRRALALYSITRNEKFLSTLLDTSALSESQKADFRDRLRDLVDVGQE